MTRPTPRGFTLLETALAAAIGGLVLLGCLSIFLAVDRSERALAGRARGTQELGIAQLAVRRVIGSLVMAPESSMPPDTLAAIQQRERSVNDADREAQEAAALAELEGFDPSNPGSAAGPRAANEDATRRATAEPVVERASRDQADPADADADRDADANTEGGTDPDAQGDDAGEEGEEGEEGEDDVILIPPEPRLIVELDASPGLTVMISQLAAQGVVLEDPTAFPESQPGTLSAPLGLPQRVEVVVNAPPLPENLALVAPGWAAQVDERLNELFDLDAVVGVPDEGGLRGVFELRPDGQRERVIRGEPLGADNDVLRGDRAAGWTLWWRPISNQERALRKTALVDPDTQPELLVGAIPVARGLRRCRWTVHDNGLPLPSRRATLPEEIPAYIGLEIETVAGLYANWLFEPAWSVMRDQELNEAAAAADDEGTGEDGADDAGEGPAPGAGGLPTDLIEGAIDRLQRGGGGAGGGPAGRPAGGGRRPAGGAGGSPRGGGGASR